MSDINKTDSNSTKYRLEGNCQYQIVCPTKNGKKTINDKNRSDILTKFNIFVNNEPLVLVYDAQISNNYIYIDMKADPSVNMHSFIRAMQREVRVPYVTWDREYLISTVSINRKDINEFLDNLSAHKH